MAGYDKAFIVRNYFNALSGAFFGNTISGVSISTSGKILSAGVDLSLIFASQNNTASWNAAYTTLTANSASWNNTTVTVIANSASWNAAYTTLTVNSGNWNNTTNVVNANSASWNSTTSTVNANSSNWNTSYTILTANSASWNSTTSTVNTNSANWGSSYTILTSNSASWNNTTNVVNANSASWNSTTSTVNTNSANWDTSYTTITANSASWGSGSGNTSVNAAVTSNSANWNTSYTTLTANSANWNSTYATVTANSASWGSGSGNAAVNAAVTTNSANWNTSYTTLTANSSSWFPAGTGTEIQFKNGNVFGAVSGSSVLGTSITAIGGLTLQTTVTAVYGTFITLRTLTPATSAVQYTSPALRFTTTGWNTTVSGVSAVSASRPVDAELFLQSNSAPGEPDSTAIFRFRTNSGAWTNLLSIRHSTTNGHLINIGGVQISQNNGSTFVNTLDVGGNILHNANGLTIRNDYALRWSSTTQVHGAADLFLRRRSAHNLCLGTTDTSAINPQTISVQSVAAGTTNSPGSALCVKMVVDDPSAWGGRSILTPQISA